MTHLQIWEEKVVDITEYVAISLTISTAKKAATKT